MKNILLITLFFGGLMVSAINPHDYFTWTLEVLPALIGFTALAFTVRGTTNDESLLQQLNVCNKLILNNID